MRPGFKAFLETQMASHQPVIHSVTLTMKENIYGFQGNVKSPYLKITVVDHKMINRVRSTIENGLANWKGMWKGAEGGILTFDSIQYVLRFMIDNHVSGLASSERFLLTRRRSRECRGWKHPPDLTRFCPTTCDTRTARSKQRYITEISLHISL